MFWTQIEGRAYWICFLAAFGAVGLWETFRPRAALIASSGRRWGSHGLLLIISTIVSAGLFRTSLVMAAVAVEGSHFGLLNRPWMPFAIRFILSFLVLDLLRYAQHLLSHSVPLLWRLHCVHHSDPDCDVSTGARAHPLEQLINQGIYLGAIVLLAPPAAAVFAVELVDLFQSFFSHANATLPEWIEKPLRSILVTPEMHRIHHSEEVRDQTSNFGDIFSWWDRLFNTYTHAPAVGRRNLRVGLKGFQDVGSMSILFMLKEPFRRRAGQP